MKGILLCFEFCLSVFLLHCLRCTFNHYLFLVWVLFGKTTIFISLFDSWNFRHFSSSWHWRIIKSSNHNKFIWFILRICIVYLFWLISLWWYINNLLIWRKENEREIAAFWFGLFYSNVFIKREKSVDRYHSFDSNYNENCFDTIYTFENLNTPTDIFVIFVHLKAGKRSMRVCMRACV